MKEDIIMNAVFFGVVIASFILGFHMVNNDIEIDTTPIYWPETFEPYPEPPEDYYEDDMDYYEDDIMNDVWDQGPCGDINDSI